MEQLFKMPKQHEPNTGGMGHKRPMLGRRPVYRLPPIPGKIIDPSQKKPRRKHVMGPKMPVGIRPITNMGSDLRDLLKTTHTKGSIDRIKVGFGFNHAVNLFDHAHHGWGMGAVRGGHSVGFATPRGGLRVGQILK
jgi:hypothetical protein